MKKIIVPAFIAFTVITSCGNSEAETTTPSSTTPASVTTPATTSNVQPVQNPQPSTVQAPVVNANPTAAGLNPAHGQPGHRCDISVGAPLNSAPNPTANTAPQQVVTPSVQAPITAQPAVTAPGMNPQHGQPGHRCDIAVGALLNSKPTQ